MIHYFDTSAVAKLLFLEAESLALARFLGNLNGRNDEIVSSRILETELLRTAFAKDLSEQVALTLLSQFDLHLPDLETYARAGRLPGTHLWSLDAIHLASALQLRADVLVSYDSRQLTAATAMGLRIASPGRS